MHPAEFAADKKRAVVSGESDGGSLSPTILVHQKRVVFTVHIRNLSLEDIHDVYNAALLKFIWTVT